MMKDLRAVHRYCRALYELAEKAGKLDVMDDQLLAVRKLVDKHPEISNLVSNSTITLAEKEDFLSKIVPADTLPVLINFLKVLVKKKRFRELAAIQEEFHRDYEKQCGIEEVTVISAVPLSAENAAKLKETLKLKLKSDIQLIAKTDSKIIGGLILRFGGQEINASFRARLDSLHQLLTA
jgi:F-type H+-transporting ATPase subunit delta